MFKKINYKKIIYEKKFITIFYLLGYFSLVYGFIYNENSSIGAFYDFAHHSKVLDEFAKDLSGNFFNYSNYFHNYHSPLFLLLLHLFENIFNSRDLMRFFFLHICLLIPFLFYTCLIKRYMERNKNYLVYVPLLFFLSPYYRSLAIWPGSENISLIFLILSFWCLLNYENSKNNKRMLLMTLNILFLALSAYIRPIYCFFSLYFFIYYLKNLEPKHLIFKYILLNIILSLPAFYYVVVLDQKFFLPTIEHSFTITATVNRICFISTIFLFYLIPFLISYFFSSKKNYSINNIHFPSLFFGLLTIIPFIIYFDYDTNHGGGFLFKLSSFIFGNNILFYFIILLALYFIFSILFEDIKNRNFNDSILILTIFLLEIDQYVYHETYDPLLYILFLILFKTKLIKSFLEINIKRNLFILFTFCSVFYLMSLLKDSFNI